MKQACSIALIAIVILSACTAKRATNAMKTMSDAEIIGEIKRNYTEAQMEEGKVIWQTNCNRCHKLYTPGSYTIAEWENILPRMYPRTKLDKEQSGKVRAYILPNAKRS